MPKKRPLTKAQVTQFFGRRKREFIAALVREGIPHEEAEQHWLEKQRQSKRKVPDLNRLQESAAANALDWDDDFKEEDNARNVIENIGNYDLEEIDHISESSPESIIDPTADIVVDETPQAGPSEIKKRKTDGDSSRPMVWDALKKGVNAGVDVTTWEEIDGTENQMQVDPHPEHENQPNGNAAATTSMGDNDGAGGSGGDIQGPGNLYFEGFGTNTANPGANVFTVKKRYDQTFQWAADFTGQRKCEAKVDTKNKDLRDATQEDVEIRCNHAGVVWPYDDLCASTTTRHWNLPDHCIGYRVIDCGFNVNHMHVTTRPNDKVTTEQVVTETPCFARMWFFVDLHGDYGLKQKDDESFRHSDEFMDHHGVTSVKSRYLGHQTDRAFRMAAKDFHCILDNRAWTKDGDIYKCVDPDHFYDFRQHKGYREQLCSEGKFEFHAKLPEHPFTLFPHDKSNTLDWSKVWPSAKDDNYVWMDSARTLKYVSGYEWPKDTVTDLKVTANWNNFFLHKYQPHVLRDRYGMQKQTSKDELGLWPYIPDNSTTKTDEFFSVNCTRTSNPVCDPITGQVRLNFGQRMPLVLMGVHKDLEVKSTGASFYNYHAHGQVTYFSEIEYLYMSPVPAYIPLGIGGFWNEKADFDTVMKDGLIKSHMKARKDRRRHMNPYVSGIPGNIHRVGDKYLGYI